MTLQPASSTSWPKCDSSPAAKRSSQSLDKLRAAASVLLCAFAAIVAIPSSLAFAQPPEPIRRVYVPEAQLGAVLKADKFSSVMPRDEFDALVRAAREAGSASGDSNREPALSSAVHRARTEGDLLLSDLKLSVTTWRPHSEVEFGIEGWNVLSAGSDEQSAHVTRTGPQLEKLRLFLPRAGTHEVQLQLSTPWKTAGSDQLTTLGLTGAAAERVELTVPAGKFLQMGGSAVARPGSGDQPAVYNVDVGGRGRVQLTLTDRRQATRQDRLTFASTAYGIRVEPGSVTWTAQTRLEVFGQSIDQLECSIPSTLEITHVESSGLESWELSDAAGDAGRTHLRLKYRQPFDGSRTVTFRGVVTTVAGESWTAPALRIASVASHVGRVLVTYPSNMRLDPVETAGARIVPVPGNITAGDAAQAWEVWQDQFQLRFLSIAREQVVTAAMTCLLDANAQGLDLAVTVTFQTRQSPLFEGRIRLPAEFLTRQVQVDGASASFEVVPDEAGVNEVRIPFASPLPPGGTRTVTLQAQLEPEGWPVKEAPLTIALPEVRLPQAQAVEALYGVSAAEDLDVTPQSLNGLDPARRADMELLQSKSIAGGQRTRLGFTATEAAYSGQLQLVRRPTLFTARTLTFFRLEQEQAFTRLEANLSISGGGLQTLNVRVDEALGADVRFTLAAAGRGAATAQIVQQTASAVTEGLRTFTLEFDRHLQGDSLLFTDVRVPRGGNASQAVPRMVFPQAEAQSGFIAVESAADRNATITAVDASGAALPVVDPVDFPAARYRPRERVVSGHSYVQPGWRIEVGSAKLEAGAVPNAIGHRADLVSILAGHGEFQHFSSIQLTAHGAQSLLVRLPTDARLWSTVLDSQPVESRRTAAGIHVPLRAAGKDGRHLLQLAYSTQLPALEPEGELRTSPPQVMVVTGTGTEQPLEILEQKWQLHAPADVSLLDSTGRFQPQAPLAGDSWVGRLRQAIQRPTWRQLEYSGYALGMAVGILLILALIFRAIARSARPLAFFRVAVVMLLLGVFCLTMFFMLMPMRSGTPGYVVIQSPPGESRQETLPQSYYLRDDVQYQPFGAVDPDFVPPAGAPSLVPAPARVMQEEGQAGKDSDLDGASDRLRPPLGRNDLNAPALGSRDRWSGDVAGLLGQLPAIPPQFPNQSLPPPLADGPVALEKGLLSLVVPAQIPADSRAYEFQYRGAAGADAGPDLSVTYTHGRQGRMLAWAIAAATLLLGWWLRKAGAGTRITWSVLTVIVPVAALGLVPVQHAALLEGVLLGGVLTLLVWLARSLALCVKRSCTSMTSAVVATVAIALVLQCGHVLAADAPPAGGGTPYVVIPYESLDQIDAAQHVWVPAELYQKLWSAAHPEDAAIPAASVPFAIAQASYVAELQAGTSTPAVVRLNARWVIVSLKDHPQTVSLPIRGVAFSQVQLNGRPAPVVADERGQPAVVIAGRGVSIVDAVAELPAEVNRLVGSFTLELLPVGAGQLVFALPAVGEKLRVRVNGLTGGFRRAEVSGGGVERIEIPIDRGGKIAINWQPEQQGRDAAQLVQLESEIRANVSESGVHYQHRYIARVRQGQMQDLDFTLPAGLAVRRISGADVAGWELADAAEAGSRRLRVFFRRQVTDNTEFAFDLSHEHTLVEAALPLSAPDVRASSASRETGLFLWHVPAHLRLLISRAEGAQQMDLSQAPARPNPELPLVAAYRFAARPFTLQGELSRRPAELRVTAEHGISVDTRRVRIASRLLLNLGDAPRRRIELSLPANFQPVDVVCAEATDWFVAGGSAPTLVIEFGQPRQGEVEVGLEGRIPKLPESPNVEILVPRVAQAARQAEQVGIWFDDVYRPTLADAAGWRVFNPAELPQRITALQSKPPQFALRGTGEGATARFATPRAVPDLTGDAAVLIAAGDASVDYGLTLRWNIASAASDRFSFTVPDWLGRLDITAAGVRQMQSTSAGNGRTRWNITLVEPVKEQFLLTAAATIPLPADLLLRAPLVEFESTSSAGVEQPLAVQRSFAVLVNLSTYQLSSEDLSQFESIPADQLPLKLPPNLVQQAMEVVRVRTDRLPVWRAVRAAVGVGARAVAHSGEMQTVLESDGGWRTVASWAIRNRGQQFLGLRLPEGSRVLGVFVRGASSRTVTAILNQQPIHLIALPQTSGADLSFDVQLLLAGRLSEPLVHGSSLAARQIEIPAPQILTQAESSEFGLPVAQTLWRIHVPDEVDVFPVTRSGAGNVTFHAGDAEEISQRQVFERLRADVGEMSRIQYDSNASVRQRTQSLNNLKQLNQAVQSVNDAELRDEAERALRAAEEREKKPAMNDLYQTVPNNREFILGNNGQVLEGNSIGGMYSAEPEGAKFNFFGQADAKRSNNESLRKDTDRSSLKSQIRDQTPMQQSLQDEFRAVQRFNAPQQPLSGPQRQQALPVINGVTITMPQTPPANAAAGEAMEESAAPVTDVVWTNTSGLSVPMQLPVAGRKLTFSKVGGNPQLTVSVRQSSSWRNVLAWVWGAAVLGLGFLILRRHQTEPAFLKLFRLTVMVGLLAGVLGTLLLPGDLRDASLFLFCAAGLAQAILWARSAVATK